MEYPQLSIEELEVLVNDFLVLDPRTTSVDRYQEIFSRMITEFKFSQHELPKGIKLHRIRINWEGLDFPGLHDFWHRPLSDITKGRMNDVGQPILYISVGGHTAFREVEPPKNINFSCIEYEVTEPIKLVDIGLMHYKLNHHNFLKQWAYNDEKAMEIVYRNNPHLLNLDRRLKAFIADSFTRRVEEGKEYLYNVSIAIAQQFLLSNDVDGIAYPSVRSDLKDVNIGLKSIPAFSKLKANRIDVFKVSNEKTSDGDAIIHPVIGCYKNIIFGSKIIYTEPRDVEGWVRKIDF